jgi:cytochrome c553
MNRVVAIVLLVACRSSEPPAPQPTPASETHATSPEELVALSCTACHGADLLAQQRITTKQWEAGVKKMVGWGALVETKDQPALVAYLASRYDGSAAPYTPTEANEDALAAVEPTDDGGFAGGAVERGQELYLHLCAACHAQDGRGNAIGTNLVDRYLLFRAADFATVVRAGRGRMASQPLTDSQIADLLAFLRTLGSA